MHGEVGIKKKCVEWTGTAHIFKAKKKKKKRTPQQNHLYTLEATSHSSAGRVGTNALKLPCHWLLTLARASRAASASAAIARWSWTGRRTSLLQDKVCSVRGCHLTWHFSKQREREREREIYATRSMKKIKNKIPPPTLPCPRCLGSLK